MGDSEFDLVTLAAAITQVAAGVNGVRMGFYPAPDAIEKASTPAIVTFVGSNAGDTMIAPDTDGDLWRPQIMMQLIVPREGNTPKEFLAADALIVPIVRAFNRRVPANTILQGVGFHVDRCRINRVRGSLQIPFAGVIHHGAEFHFDIKVHDWGLDE